MLTTTSTLCIVPIGVGIDTGRYGHHVTFLNTDLNDAAKPFNFTESADGYQQLRAAFQKLADRHADVRFHVRLDVAGQYATNLEAFLRQLPFPMILSVGEPDRNRKYREVHFPKRKADPTESRSAARFALVEQPRPAALVPPEIVQLREIASRVESQSRQVTRLTNQLHNLLSRVFPELASLTRGLSAKWTLLLLKQCPTPEFLSKASLDDLAKIPYLSRDKAQRLQRAAGASVASLRGAVAEQLVRGVVDQLLSALDHQERLVGLMKEHHLALPQSNLIDTIPGIGPGTAAVLTAKMVSIDYFQSPDALVSYFGTFPQEYWSGVDRDGQPKIQRHYSMSRKGNDLVRKYLWNAAKSAIRCNPAVKPLYRRLRQRGSRGDVALGHCMRKLLHLVFAIWKTARPFDRTHYDWEHARHTDQAPTRSPGICAQSSIGDSAGGGQIAEATDAPTTDSTNQEAAGHRQGTSPGRKVVTAADSKVDPEAAAVKPIDPLVESAGGGRVDFALLRQQISLEQVLAHLNHLDKLRGSGAQRRGPCPVHDSRGKRSNSFSANLDKNVFRCFHPPCAIQGNVLDLWAAVQELPLREAAQHLAATFQLDQFPQRGTEKRNPSAEPVIHEPRREVAFPKKTAKMGVITPDAT